MARMRSLSHTLFLSPHSLFSISCVSFFFVVFFIEHKIPLCCQLSCAKFDSRSYCSHLVLAVAILFLPPLLLAPLILSALLIHLRPSLPSKCLVVAVVGGVDLVVPSEEVCPRLVLPEHLGLHHILEEVVSVVLEEMFRENRCLLLFKNEMLW